MYPSKEILIHHHKLLTTRWVMRAKEYAAELSRVTDLIEEAMTDNNYVHTPMEAQDFMDHCKAVHEILGVMIVQLGYFEPCEHGDGYCARRKQD